MWSTRNALAAALLLGAAACGGAEEAADTPAYLPDSVREQQERESVQIERLSSGLSELNWRIQAIGDIQVIPDSEPFLRFSSDGTVSGSTGCNTFNGGWSLDRNQIDFGALAATRKLCPDPMMDQEQSILTILNNAVLVGIGDEGTLFITTLEGALLTALPGDA